MTPAERDGPHWRAWKALRREERRRFALRHRSHWLQSGRDVGWMLRGTRWDAAVWAREAEAGVERQTDAALTAPAPEDGPCECGRRVPRAPSLDDYDRRRGDHPGRSGLTLEDAGWPVRVVWRSHRGRRAGAAVPVDA